MKTLFSLGFQPYNPFSVRHPSLSQTPRLGDELDATARQKLVTKINAAKAKWAQVDTWLKGRFAVDPTLIQTFKQQYIVDNVYGYIDIINKDQYEVDMALAKASSADPINWDFEESRLSRVEEYIQVVDIMYAAMQEYGGVAGTAPRIQTMGPTTTATGAPVQTKIAPGATVATPPPSTGISTQTLLIGGGVAAALIGLVLALKA